MLHTDMPIIGITGRAGSGKDTAAEVLVKERGFQRIAFADPIRQMIEVLGVDCTTRAAKEQPIGWLGVTPRYLMQTLGTEWGRRLIDENLWLLVMENSLELAEQTGATGVVIPDVRFDNEAELIHDLGGQVWHIARQRAQKVEAHASEAGIQPEYVNQWILNDGSIDDLREQVVAIMAGFAVEP